MFVPQAYADLNLSLIDDAEAHPSSAVTPGLPGPASRVPAAVAVLAVAAVVTVAICAIGLIASASRRGEA